MKQRLADKNIDQSEKDRTTTKEAIQSITSDDWKKK